MTVPVCQASGQPPSERQFLRALELAVSAYDLTITAPLYPLEEEAARWDWDNPPRSSSVLLAYLIGSGSELADPIGDLAELFATTRAEVRAFLRELYEDYRTS